MTLIGDLELREFGESLILVFVRDAVDKGSIGDCSSIGGVLVFEEGEVELRVGTSVASISE